MLPTFSDRVNDLIAEHGELRGKSPVWSNWQAGVTVTAAWWEKMGGDFAQFTDRLMRHEEVENELVQLVFTEDIGSKD